MPSPSTRASGQGTGPALCLLAGLCAPAGLAAQEAAPPQKVVVVGQRAALVTAGSLKRAADGIVDSVLADDVQALPDFSVADALQRVTGVQVERDRGDGTGVTVRGLTQIETLFNGREVFTAGGGRALDFSDVPAELVGRIDVHKTWSADELEGGAGGTVDLRTRRPFDFAGRTLAVTLRAVRGGLVARTEPQVSVLWSDRFRLAGGGEWGLLADLALQRRAWREDQISSGNPIPRTDLLPGQTVYVPNGVSETTSVGRRDRQGGSLIAQWRPDGAWDAYAEAHWASFRTRQDSYQISAFAPGNGHFDPTSVALFPGTLDVRHITWLDAPLSVLSFARDTRDREQQFALGAHWRGRALRVSLDASRTHADESLLFSGPALTGTAARFTQDLGSTVPSASVSGTDLLSPSTYRFSGLDYRSLPFAGRLDALRADAERDLGGPLWRTLAAGVRITARTAGNDPGLVFGDLPVDVAASAMPGFTQPSPYPDLLAPAGGTSLGQHLVGNLALARDPAALRAAFGVATPLPTAGNPLGVWHIEERSRAAYVQGRYGDPDGPLRGDIGLRAVQVAEHASGHQSAPGSPQPIDIDTRRTDWLPAALARWEPRPGLVLRAAASRTLTRPDFSQLSPSLTLVANTVNAAQNSGSAGNPALKPVRSDNLDLAVERYAGSSLAAVTLFVKQVDGFLVSASQPETYDGVTYQVSRPQNGGRGHIAGAEVAGQCFPRAWRGLGLQLNYTYVDSRTNSTLAGQDTPLPNLSRQSANLVGLYERGPTSLRLAWNWRSSYLAGTANIVGIGTLPITMRGYGWLDASWHWRFAPRWTVSLEGLNLLRTVRSSYYSGPTMPQSSWRNDAQYSVAISARL